MSRSSPESAHVSDGVRMQQDQDVSTKPSSNAITLCRKSWAAFTATFIRALLVTALMAAVLYWKDTIWKPVAVIWAVAMLLIAYRWLLIRSFHLYYDDI